MTDSADPKVREAAKASSAALRYSDDEAGASQRHTWSGCLVRIIYVYLSNEADVLREMKSFLATFR